MLFKLQATFRPKVLNDLPVKGNYTDEQLDAMGFFFQTPVEHIEAIDQVEACDIISDKYQSQCGIISPDIVVTFFPQ